MTQVQQLDLFTEIEQQEKIAALEECEHESGFHTMAFIPGGIYCDNCDKIILRDLSPVANEPEIIGYKSADWCWKYEKGNTWDYDCID